MKLHGRNQTSVDARNSTSGFARAARKVAPSRPQDVAMNQVSADVAREHVADVLLRESVAVVHRAAGCRGEPAAELLGPVQIVLVVALLAKRRALLTPFLRSRQRIHRSRRPSVVGDVLRHFTNFEQRSAREILHRHHDVPDMSGVLGDKAITEIVDRRTELRRSRCGFRLAADRDRIGSRYRAPALAPSQDDRAT